MRDLAKIDFTKVRIIQKANALRKNPIQYSITLINKTKEYENSIQMYSFLKEQDFSPSIEN